METKLKHIVTKQFGILDKDVGADTDIVLDLNADSLDLMELVMAIEQEFGISIEEHEYQSCHTFGRILDLIKNKMPR